MKEVKIYQASLDSKIAFCNYEMAQDMNIEINLDDYKEVANYYLSSDKEDYIILESIFRDGNNGTLKSKFTMRSVSVSDIVELDGVKYFCDSFGFKKLEV